jgi:triacylglycerol lipase
MNIVLAHGILGFDEKFNVDYFNCIKKHLKDKHQAKVLATKVHPTDSIKARGDELGKQILEGFKNGKLDRNEKTHIVAHSMGGLDGRYILSPDNKDNIAHFITSLTTIGTPHQGSPIADLAHSRLDGKADLFITKIMEEKIVEALNLLGVSINGLKDLTTREMEQFNSQYKDNPNVKYFWTAGIGRKRENRTTSWPFSPTYNYLYDRGQELYDKQNDGVVPLSSAKRDNPNWEQIGDLWNADHAEEVGHNLDRYFPFWDKTDGAGVLKALTGDFANVSANALPEGLLDRYDEIMGRLSLL